MEYILKNQLLTTSVLLVVLLLNLYQLEAADDLLVQGKRLTTFWAQEYAGVDLVKEELEKILEKERISVAIFDSGFEREYILVDKDVHVDSAKNGRRDIIGHHGTSVANLIYGAGKYSASEVVDFSSLVRTNYVLMYGYTLKNFSNRPRLISNSLGWRDRSIFQVARSADDKGVIWVLAAAYEQVEEFRPYENLAPVINVGSYAPSGLLSMTSQDFKGLDILAPADRFQASIDGKGRHVLFGESSGATPIVTGTIANILSILPNLTRKEVIYLLRKTAYPSLNKILKTPSKAGLLNGYKLFRVVKRIVESCEDDTVCRAKLLKDKDIFVFITPDTIDKIAKSSFPKCYGENRSGDRQQSETIKLLRRHVALNFNNISLLNILSCAYKEIGFEKNSEFFHHLSLIQTDLKKRVKEMGKCAIQAINNDDLESAYLRATDLYGDSFRKFLEEKISISSGSQQINLKYLLSQYIQKYTVKLLSHKNIVQELMVSKKDLNIGYINDLKEILNKVNSSLPYFVKLTVVGEDNFFEKEVDPWLQDFAEFMYIKNKVSTNWKPLLLDTNKYGMRAFSRSFAKEKKIELKILDNPSDTYGDHGGNIETTPSDILYTSSNISKEMLGFFTQHGYEDHYVKLDLNFLKVGHVDEVVTMILADNECGFNLVVASPELGLEMLKESSDKDVSRVPFYSSRSRRRAKFKKLHISVKSDDGSAILEGNRKIQKKIDTQISLLVDKIKWSNPYCENISTIKMPVLYKCDFSKNDPTYCQSLLPNIINMVVINDQFIVPDPFLAPFREYVNKELEKYGDVHFLDDSYYHRGGGNVHCSLNIIRSLDEY